MTFTKVSCQAHSCSIGFLLPQTNVLSASTPRTISCPCSLTSVPRPSEGLHIMAISRQMPAPSPYCITSSANHSFLCFRASFRWGNRHQTSIKAVLLSSRSQDGPQGRSSAACALPTGRGTAIRLHKGLRGREERGQLSFISLNCHLERSGL